MNEQHWLHSPFPWAEHLASNWASFPSSEPCLAPFSCCSSNMLPWLPENNSPVPLWPASTPPHLVSNGSSPFWLRLPRQAFRNPLISFSRLMCFPCSSVGAHHIILISDDNAPLQLHYEFLKGTFVSDWDGPSMLVYGTLHLLIQCLCTVWFSWDPVL